MQQLTNLIIKYENNNFTVGLCIGIRFAELCTVGDLIEGTYY